MDASSAKEPNPRLNPRPIPKSDQRPRTNNTVHLPNLNRLLQLGERHFLVKTLQLLLNQRLIQPHFSPLKPLETDGIFGPLTERRVMLAQFRYLLFQNGIVDDMLWRSLQEDKALIAQFPVLRRYSLGQPVSAVQQLLKTVGLYEGRVDQRFGPETEAAIQDFQARQTPPLSSVIAANGMVGHHTWVTLERLALRLLTAH